jgi:hypothetical protein
MKVLPRLILFSLLIFSLAPETRSQELPNLKDSLVRALVAEGFENVGIYSEKKDVYLFYENRRYRSEVDGISRVLQKVAMACSDSSVLHLVPMHHEIPVTVITTGVKAYREKKAAAETGLSGIPVRSLLNTDSVQALQKKIQLQNRTFGRIDLLFLPGLRLQYGNFDQPIEWMVSISPIVQTSLWKGSLVSAQVFIPIHNELQYQYESKPRLETATINQLFRLPKNVFVYASAGLFPFTNNIGPNIYFQRYGVSIDIRKYFWNGRASAGVTTGYTGIMSLNDGYLNYYPEKTMVNFAFFGEYREPRYDFTTRITAGKFLYEDYAVKLEVSRQFHELNLSFFAIKSNLKSPGENGTVGGIALAIPIAPRKSPKPAPFRANLAKYFNFDYTNRIIDPVGRSYRINPDWNDTFRNLNPDFVEKQLNSQQ